MTLKIKYPSQQPSITSIIVAINPPIDEKTASNKDLFRYRNSIRGSEVGFLLQRLFAPRCRPPQGSGQAICPIRHTHSLRRVLRLHRLCL